MSSGNLSCAGCRIRVRASAPNIGLLEGNCPICGAELSPPSSASSVLGFRSFDLDALSEQDVNRPPVAPGGPVDLDARRKVVPARAAVDTDWSVEGRGVDARAVAESLPAP